MIWRKFSLTQFRRSPSEVWYGERFDAAINGSQVDDDGGPGRPPGLLGWPPQRYRALIVPAGAATATRRADDGELPG